MTVHGAKRREFDFVYLIGLAEDILPSFQSRQKGDGSPEMEEERRNCFVAITRAKESLILSRANIYRGWRKQPSRFLVEMGLVQEQ
jgi:ATP-dependent DNA helicase UvrD/PcrA